MASIIMHLAVSENIIKHGNTLDRDRLLFGTILPDYAFEENAHYKKVEGDRKFFNITKFRAEYGDKINTNAIYLGYYLHLVQDMVFRDFMYNTHGWDPSVPGNVSRLYGDYRRLNGYLIDKFSLSTDILKNTDYIPSEEYPDFTLNKAELIKETEKHLGRCEEGDYFFFTPDMANDFIEKATAACLNELSALKGEKAYLNEKEYSWKIHKVL